MNSGEKKVGEKDFDLLLKSKMEQEELQATPKGWDNLFKELHPDEERALPFAATPPSNVRVLSYHKRWWAAACAVVAVTFLSVWALLPEKQVDDGMVHKQPTPNENVPESIHPNSNTPIQENSTSHTAATTTTTKIGSINTVANHSLHKKVGTEHVSKTVLKDNNSHQNNQYVIPTPNDKVEDKNIVQVPGPIKDNYQPKRENITFLYPDGETRRVDPVRPNRSVAIGLNGGYNFGNLNSGYAVALKGRANINSQLYVDATVGINMNNLPYTAASVPVSSAKARPTNADQNSVHLPAVKNPTQQLLYVQFNPSVGYKVTNRINVSVGGDLQRIVKDRQSDEINVIFSPEKNKAALIPQTDLGITAKTEVKIAKHLSAGLLYREGINNMLHSKGSNDMSYINRRYMQVQLTYNIVGKM